MSKTYGKATLTKIEIHPIVLLSVTDHYNRVAKDTKKRVVGCLLGQRRGTVLDVTNSFAVPFDEEDRSPATWFLDYNFLEDMAHMFKRVNQRELVVGWYSTGPKLKRSDIEIHKLFYEYCKEPVCAIIRVAEDSEDLPTNTYVGVDVVQADGRHEKEFAHIESCVTASEAEAVGIEHLLREIQDISVSTLTREVNRKLTSLHGLAARLQTIRDYLTKVLSGALPVNQDILTNLQLIFNLLPNLSKKELIESFAIKKNDTMLNIYIASLLRSILAMDRLLENKLENKRREEKQDADKKGKKKEEEKKDKEKDDEKDGKDDKSKGKDKDKDSKAKGKK